MKSLQLKMLSRMGLLIAVMVLALAGCAAVPMRSALYRPSLYNDSGLYGGYMWNDGYGPYPYGPYFGLGYGWMPYGWDNGFMGGGDDYFDDDDEGPGR